MQKVMWYKFSFEASSLLSHYIFFFVLDAAHCSTCQSIDELEQKILMDIPLEGLYVQTIVNVCNNKHVPASTYTLLKNFMHKISYYNVTFK